MFLMKKMLPRNSYMNTPACSEWHWFVLYLLVTTNVFLTEIKANNNTNPNKIVLHNDYSYFPSCVNHMTAENPSISKLRVAKLHQSLHILHLILIWKRTEVVDWNIFGYFTWIFLSKPDYIITWSTGRKHGRRRVMCDGLDKLTIRFNPLPVKLLSIRLSWL